MGANDNASASSRPTFVGQPRPVLCAVITARTPTAALHAIRTAEFDGAQSFLFDLRTLEEKFHNVADLSSIFGATDKPVMVYYYRPPASGREPVTDEVRADAFRVCVQAGASAVDMMADLFDPSELEITRDPAAIGKQLALMTELRSLGGEVMLSSHTCVPMSTEEIVAHVDELVSRKPDMVKIVPRVPTEDHLLEAMRTTTVLREHLTIPFIHIVMGEHNRIHRLVGPMLGSAVCFCVPYYTEDSTLEQPLLRATRDVFNNFAWRTPQAVKNAEKGPAR